MPKNFTRVTVVHGGTSREYWAEDWDMSLCDEERTLKLFARGGGTTAKAVRDEALARDLSQATIYTLANLPDNPYRVDLCSLDIVLTDQVANGTLEVVFCHAPTGIKGKGPSTREAWSAFKENLAP